MADHRWRLFGDCNAIEPILLKSAPGINDSLIVLFLSAFILFFKENVQMLLIMDNTYNPGQKWLG